MSPRLPSAPGAAPVTAGAGAARPLAEYLSPDCQGQLRHAIAEAGGNEVFFVLRREGERGPFTHGRAVARGHRSAVVAIQRAARHGDAVAHNHPSGWLAPSEPDMALAAMFSEAGVGFFIIDNPVGRLYAVMEPPDRALRPLVPAQVEQLLGPGGALSRRLPGYEARPQQLQMAHLHAQAINTHGVGVIEAGTGTGKSLAYLVPSALYALANRERVVVATRTVTLQQQLLQKDLPLVQSLLPDLKVALVTGRGRYLCRRKLATRQAELGEGTPAEERAFIERIGAWAETSADGHLSDLPFVPDGELWELVSSSSDQTLRARCPHYQSCFYYQSRRRAAGAQLLLANHALLLADLAVKRDSGNTNAGVLPRFDRLVIDEAHHITEAASSFGASRVSGWGLRQLLGRLKPIAGKRRKGLLVRALKIAGQVERMRDRVVALGTAVESLQRRLPLLELELGEQALRLLGESDFRGERFWRFKEVASPAETLLLEQVELWQEALMAVERPLGRLVELLEDLPEGTTATQLRFDLKSVERRFESARASLGAVLQGDPNRARWIQVRRRRGELRVNLATAPIDVAPIIKQEVIDGTRAVTFTSATLSVDQRLTHFHRSVGLIPPRPGGGGRVPVSLSPEAPPTAALADPQPPPRARFEAVIDSPFDYRRQVYLGLPSDAPPPDGRGQSDWLAMFVSEAIRVCQGRTFVLFTSYRLMRAVSERVERTLGSGYELLVQGSRERGRLLARFRVARRAALFGTDSFWEGVDVQGDALSCVILTRLPFRVPRDPLQEARAEAISARGGDPFQELSLPQAVIRFKQGFGRLIRSRSDRGAVLVTDPRLVTRRYGRRFLASLPPLALHQRPGPQLLREMGDFLSACAVPPGRDTLP